MESDRKIQTTENKATEESLVALDVEDFDQYKEIERPDHYHPFHQVVLVIGGQGKIIVSNTEHLFQAGDVIMLPQNTVHSVREPEQLSTLIINFTEEMLMGLPLEIKQVIDYNLLIRKAFRIFTPKEEDFSDIRIIFTALKKEAGVSRKARYHSEAENGLFTAYISTVIRAVNKDTMRRVVEDKMFSDLIRLIEQNFRSHLKVNDYAMMLGVSAKTLERHVMKIAKTTPQKMVAQKLTSEAKMILRSTKTPVKQVALELGFCDIAHFTNFFKNNAGMTPTSFRNCNSPFGK